MRRCMYVIVLAASSVVGCAEIAAPPGPTPSTGADRVHADITGSYPSYPSAADVPAAYSLARIESMNPLVYWQGAYANASSSLGYYGNYGEQSLNLSITKNGSQVAATAAAKNDEHFWPASYQFTISGVGLQVSSACGHEANLNVRYDAKMIFLFKVRDITVFSYVFDHATSSKEQPGCQTTSCTSTVSNDQTAYGGDFDPYAPSPGGCDGGSGTGTGTQYQVGDYTGGQTVDWKTGKGTGKLSACGDQARVDYICVEYNTGNGWESLDCGYVTTC
jgi:hypothetical protein